MLSGRPMVSLVVTVSLLSHVTIVRCRVRGAETVWSRTGQIMIIAIVAQALTSLKNRKLTANAHAENVAGTAHARK